MMYQLIATNITLGNLEQIVILLSVAGTLGSFIFWANSKQDSLVSKFVNIDSRHFRLRARLALSFQKIAYTLRSLDTRISDLENHEAISSGFKTRRRAKDADLENQAVEFWNESSLDDETKIPED